jgi:small subunit ribosomal protein S15
MEYDEEEVIDLIVKLRKDGKSSAQIGLELRDTYGIPDVKTVTGKKITQILDEEDVAPDTPEDLQNLVDKAANIKAHVEENPNDQDAERRLSLVEAKIRRVAKYHRDNGNIPSDWKYRRADH